MLDFTTIKNWFNSHLFNYPWHTVVYAANYKYPNNFNRNVTNIDILDRYVDEETGILFTHKLIRSQWEGFKHSTLYGSEFSAIDVRNNRMVLITKNHTASSFVEAVEVLEYSNADLENTQTILKQSSTVKTLTPLVDMCIDTYKNNAQKGLSAIEWVIENRLPTMPELQITPVSISTNTNLISSVPNEIQDISLLLDKDEIAQYIVRSKYLLNDISKDVSQLSSTIVNRGVYLARLFTKVLFDDTAFFQYQFYY